MTAAVPCEDCVRAEANPLSGRMTMSCKECVARHLAGSRDYFQSARAEALTPNYRDALQYYFGNAWRAAHERVKFHAERRDAAERALTL